ncbi:MAG: hypothetical protein KF752_10925 [Pirellulaceae bacterium]|nr:hypothetical protein [Pirellulaceae bacterium]
MDLPLKIYQGRFALLRHRPPARLTDVGQLATLSPEPKFKSHWDLLLESDIQQLLTWRLLPILTSRMWSPQVLFPQPSGDSRPQLLKATRLENHRPAYLAYEGPVSGNRGWVWRVAEGSYRVAWDQRSGQGTDRSAEIWNQLRHASGQAPTLCVSDIDSLKLQQLPPASDSRDCFFIELDDQGQKRRMIVPLSGIGEVVLARVA